MPSSRLPKRFAYAAVGLVMAGTAFVIHHGQHGFRAPFEPGHMPVCDSSTVRQLFEQTVEDAPDTKTQGIKVLKLGAMADTTKAMDDDQIKARPDRSQCVADLFTNAGRDLVSSRSTGLTTTRTKSISRSPSCRSDGARRHAARCHS